MACLLCGSYTPMAGYAYVSNGREQQGCCTQVRCLACNEEQCMSYGSARGSCGRCGYGILPGWAGCDRRCEYKGCTNRAIYKDVPGLVKAVCKDHAARPRITVYKGGKSIRIPLSEYAQYRRNG